MFFRLSIQFYIAKLFENNNNNDYYLIIVIINVPIDYTGKMLEKQSPLVGKITYWFKLNIQQYIFQVDEWMQMAVSLMITK